MLKDSYSDVTPYPLKQAQNQDTVEQAVRALLFYQEKSLFEVMLNQMEQQNDAIERFKNRVYLSIIEAGTQQPPTLKQKYKAIKRKLEKGYEQEKSGKVWTYLEKTINPSSEAHKASRGYIIPMLDHDNPKLTFYKNIFHQHEEEVDLLTDVIHSKEAVQDYSRQYIDDIRSQLYSREEYRESLEQPYRDLETAFISLSMDDQDLFEQTRLPVKQVFGIHPSQAFDMEPVEARTNAEMVKARQELLQPVFDFKTAATFDDLDEKSYDLADVPI